jgi:hypothetical protein
MGRFTFKFNWEKIMSMVKVVIKDSIEGVKYNVYKKFMGIWFWKYGYIPLTSCFFLIDEDINRLKQLYKNKLLIIDKRINK